MKTELFDDDRGQTFTLEGITASVLVLTAMLFAIQSTAVTPLSSSTSHQQIEEQPRSISDDLLDSAHEDGHLKEAVLFYDTSTETFIGANRGGYTNPPPNEFGVLLANIHDRNNVVYNIEIEYKDGDDTDSITMVDQGEPSDNAATASKVIVLEDNDEVEFGGELQNEAGFYAPNIDETSEVYNVVEVRITAWRI